MKRREFVYKSVLAGTGAMVLPGASCQEPGDSGLLSGKSILFVYGGWDGHDPAGCRDLYVPWMREQGAEVHVSDNLDIYTDKELMDSLDAVVQTWTMGTIGEEQLKGLIAAIENGAGIAGWHGGLGDAFRNSPEYQYMIGGQWVAHPGDSVPYTVNVVNREDPVMDGIEDFALLTEQYYMHVDPNNKVLATTRFNGEHNSWIDGCTMPVVWKRMHGRGRVFYSAIGHKMEDHHIPEARAIMQRGIVWASGSKTEVTQPWAQPVYEAS